MGQYTRHVHEIIRGSTARYLLTPAQTGVPAVGTVVTTGAAAWGAQVDLVAAAAIAVNYWICGFYIDTLGAAQVFEGQISDATPAVLTEFRIDVTAVSANLGLLPAAPYPIFRGANAQTQCRAGGAGTKVIGVSTLYGLGLG